MRKTVGELVAELLELPDYWVTNVEAVHTRTSSDGVLVEVGGRDRGEDT
jgi:hypothetical protein